MITSDNSIEQQVAQPRHQPEQNSRPEEVSSFTLALHRDIDKNRDDIYRPTIMQSDRYYEMSRPTYSISDRYDFYSSGKMVERYKNFAPGTDNEARLSAQQSKGERWWNGILKNTVRTANVAIGTTLGVAATIFSGMDTENTLNLWLDDLNKWTDLKLPNYKDQRERDLNFWQSLGNLDFWMDDIGQGLSMVAGIVVGEALWSFIPGVGNVAAGSQAIRMASKARSIYKNGAKLAGASAKAITTGKGKLLSTAMRDIMRGSKGVAKGAQAGEVAGKAFLGAKAASKAASVGEVLDFGRFMGSSIMFEAGLEKYHTKREAIETYYDNIYATGGKIDLEHEARFMNGAEEASKHVFWANVPLIGIGNMLVIAGMVGFHKPITKFLKSTPLKGLVKGKKPFVGTPSAKGMKFALKEHGTLQKYSKTIWSYAKAPLGEGFVEEGGQSFASNIALNYLESRYDPAGINENVSWVDGVGQAFNDSYFDKQGFKEVGIGMLIGSLGHQSGLARQTGKPSNFFKSEYAIEREGLKKMETELNEVAENIGEGMLESIFTRPQMDVIERFADINGLQSTSKASEDAFQRGDLRESGMKNQATQFRFHEIMRKAGMEDVLVESMEFQIDNIKDSDLLEQGIPQEELSRTREQLKESVKEQFERNKEAFKIAEKIAPNAMSSRDQQALAKAGINMETYTTLLALELSEGKFATQGMQRAAERLSILMGREGVSETMLLINKHGVKYREVSNQIETKLQEKEALQEELARLQQGIMPNLKAADESMNKSYSEYQGRMAAEKVPGLVAKIQSLESEIAELEGRRTDLERNSSIKSSNPFWRFVNEETDTLGEIDTMRTDSTELYDADSVESVIQEMETYLGEIDRLMQSKELTKAEKANLEMHADELYNTIEDFKYYARAQEVIAENFALRSNPKYALGTIKGLTTSLRNKIKSTIDEGTIKISDNTALEHYINKNKDKLTESDIFLLRTQDRLIQNAVSLQEMQMASSSAIIDPFTKAEYQAYEDDKSIDRYKPFLSEIIQRLVALSRGEGQHWPPKLYKVFTENREAIGKELADYNAEVGDSIDKIMSGDHLRSINLALNEDAPSFLEGLKDLIKRITNIQSKLYEMLPEGYNKDLIPTHTDYEYFQDLLTEIKKNEKNGIETDPELLELADELRDKINHWAAIAGVQISNEMYLSDLFDLASDIESRGKPIVNTDPITIGLDDLTIDVSWSEVGKGRKFAIGQVYDTGVVSSRTNGKGQKVYAVHNVTPELFIKGLGNVTEVEVGKKKFSTKDINDGKLSAESITGDDIKVTIQEADGTKRTLMLGTDQLGNIEVPLSAVQEGQLGSYLFKPVLDYKSNFQPLLQDNGDGTTTTVKSDFTFEYGGRTMNTEATKNVTVGTELGMKIPVKDKYNGRLIQAYVDAVASGDAVRIGQARLGLINQAIIYLTDGNNNLVQVLKKGESTQSNSTNDSSANMEALRHDLVGQLIESIDNNSVAEDVHDTGRTIKVGKVLSGMPNVNIISTESGYSIEFRPFDSRATKNVTDIGYYMDGKYYTRTGKALEGATNPFMKSAVKKAEAGRKIPFIVVKVGQASVAYPVRLASETVDLSNELATILSDTDMVRKARNVNLFLLDNGLDINRYGVTAESLTDSKINELIDYLGDVIVHPNIETWVDSSNGTIESHLINDALIDIDLADNPFSAPKLVMILDKNAEGQLNEEPRTPADPKIDNDVKNVDEKNMKKSTIYQEARALPMSRFEARRLWKVAHTEGMKKWAQGQGLDVATPDNYTLKQVMEYVNNSFVRTNKLSQTQTSSLYELFSDSKYNSFAEMYQALSDAFFKDGFRKITKKALEDTGLYTETELKEIMRDTKRQNEIQDMILMLGYDLANDYSIFESATKNSLLDRLTITESGNITESGKGKVMSPMQIFNSLASILAGVTNRSDFNSLVNKLEFDSIKEKFNSDKSFANYLFNLMSVLTPIKVMTIGTDGVIQGATNAITPDDVKAGLKNDGGKSAGVVKAREYLNTLKRLFHVSKGEWSEMSSMVDEMVLGLEEIFARYNIDVVGLYDTMYAHTPQDLINLVEAATKIAESTGELFADDAAIIEFTEHYNKMFGLQGESVYDYQSMPTEFKGQALVQLDTHIDDATAFREYGLIRVKGNLFQKISKLENLAETYEALYQKILQDPSVVPSDALGSILTKKGAVSKTKLNKAGNKAAIIEDLKKYHKKKAASSNLAIKPGDGITIEEMAVYSTLFGVELGNGIPTEVSVENKIASFDGNRKDLVENFPTKMKEFVLKQKISTTRLYNDVYKHFSFKNNRIRFTSTDPHTIEMAKLLLANSELASEFNNYALISQDPSIAQLARVNEGVAPTTTGTERIMYANSPELLGNYKGTVHKENGFIVTDTSSEAFIKHDGVVFEKMRDIQGAGLSVFQPLAVETDGNHLNLDVVRPEPVVIDQNELASKYSPSEVAGIVETKKLVGDEINKVNNEIKEC